MAHKIRIVPVVTETDVMATPGLDARPLANELMEKNGISGEMGNVTPLPGGYRFPLNRAGGATQITYDRSTGKTHLRASDTGVWGVLNRLHHFHGLNNRTGYFPTGKRNASNFSLGSRFGRLERPLVWENRRPGRLAGNHGWI